MLTIKDLAVSKELDTRAMSAVRGGSNFNVGNFNIAKGSGDGSAAAVIAPVTQVDVTSKLDTVTLQNFGGFQLAKVL
jgi:hypothetical protein